MAYHAARGQGPLRVRADLHKKGMQGSIVEECLQVFPDWLVHLRQASLKKFGTVPASHYADKQRQARFLGCRGFTGAQIRMALGFDTDVGIDSEE